MAQPIDFAAIDKMSRAELIEHMKFLRRQENDIEAEYIRLKAVTLSPIQAELRIVYAQLQLKEFLR